MELMEAGNVVRLGSAVRIKRERWEEYQRLHEQVWPELLALFRRYHVRNFSIYHRDGVLFGYKEYTGSDYAGDMAKLAREPLMQQWWALTDPCQLPFAQTGADGLWSDLQEIFHMD